MQSKSSAKAVLNGSATWSAARSSELYDVPRWGKGYFSVGDNGHLFVHPNKDPDQAIDLRELTDTLVLRGISPPILIRFADILKQRLAEIHAAFQGAMEDHAYQGGYCCVYPIKVNQQRQVVEEVFQFGRPYGYGLEAGSKAELLAVLAIADNNTPIICNGFKDDEYIEAVMLAKKIGRNIIPVVEKYTELDFIVQHSRRVGVRPSIGLRVRLASRGAGRWTESGGYRAKFGLTAGETLHALQQLKTENMADCIELLHFHLGSQISDIRQVKAAVNEAARIYAELARNGAGMKFLDVGGGLGIDYDGSQTDFDSSVNYTLQEYANDVVYHIQNVCNEAKIPHPTIVSESGRAIVAYHSVLVFNVLGVSELGPGENGQLAPAPKDAAQPVIDLQETYRGVHIENMLETFHDAHQAFEQVLNLFSLGYLPLEQRVLAENLYWAIRRRVSELASQLDYVPDELVGLEAALSDTYYCNFSVFQSMPDAWAIKQLFPIMPIQRLNEQPRRQAVLGDISCDSDGKVDRFIDRRELKQTLPLHSFNGEPYYIGAFLVGAYQEILGDLHNLLGDTNAVHVSLNEKGEVVLDTVVKGDTVREVLSYVEFSAENLLADFRKDVETALRDGRIGYEESGRLLRFYERGLEGYTYLEAPRDKDSGA
ncbi:MAG TPA: biosynthetic arginine decarboxylase [Vicinamibacteria bacterium]